MPNYTFRCPACGKKQTVTRPMNKATLPVLCEDDGFVMNRDFQSDFGTQKIADIWPMASYAAGVHPDDIPEMQKIDREAGVPTEYTEDGDPIFRSKRHRKKYCQVHKLFDRNAGYGDPVPEKFR